jgi:hypothetical protein
MYYDRVLDLEQKETTNYAENGTSLARRDVEDLGCNSAIQLEARQVLDLAQ